QLFRESAPVGRGPPQELALRGQLRNCSACRPLVFPRPKLRTHRRLTVRLSQGRVTACRHASAPARRPADTRRLEPDLRSVRRRITDALAATHLTSARRRQHGVCRTLTRLDRIRRIFAGRFAGLDGTHMQYYLPRRKEVEMRLRWGFRVPRVAGWCVTTGLLTVSAAAASDDLRLVNAAKNQ